MMVINNYKNYGWYIIPFSVNNALKWNKEIKKRIANDDYYEALASDVDNKDLWRRPVMNDCRRLFSYITDIFAKNTDVSGIYNVNSALCSKIDFPEKIPCNELQIDSLKYNTSMEGAFIVYYKFIGFLVFEICYNDMNIDDINSFAHRFKRMGNSRYAVENSIPTPHKDGRGRMLGNAWEVVKEIINTDIVEPFFYSSSIFNNECNILQFVNMNLEKGNSAEHCLGRGYDSSFFGIDMKEDSQVDMCFTPYSYIKWRGCQSVVACITNPDIVHEKSVETEYYLKTFFPNAIKNDYLYMYIFLILQRYMLLYFIREMTKAKNDNNKLEKIYNEVLNFKQCISFNVVSDELTYQNIYNEMMRILDINKLFEDINDLSEKVMSQDEKRQQGTMELISLVLAIMGIAEIIPTVLGGFVDESVVNLPSSIISIVLIFIACVVLVIDKFKSKVR